MASLTSRGDKSDTGHSPARDNFMAHPLTKSVRIKLTKDGGKFDQLSMLVLFESRGEGCLTLCSEENRKGILPDKKPEDFTKG